MQRAVWIIGKLKGLEEGSIWQNPGNIYKWPQYLYSFEDHKVKFILFREVCDNI